MAMTETNLIVRPDCLRLPAAKVAARIAVIQLEAVVFVPSRIQDRHAERAQTCARDAGVVGVSGDSLARDSACDMKCLTHRRTA